MVFWRWGAEVWNPWVLDSRMVMPWVVKAPGGPGSPPLPVLSAGLRPDREAAVGFAVGSFFVMEAACASFAEVACGVGADSARCVCFLLLISNTCTP